MTPSQVCVSLAFGRMVAKMTPSFDYLLGRAAANSQLQASTRDEIGGACVLRHVMRVVSAKIIEMRQTPEIELI
jgi:hypothetical protein